MAEIKHIGISMSSAELFDMFGLDQERFFDTTDTSRLQMLPLKEGAKEEFIQLVVNDAEHKRQKPRRLDAQEYVDLLLPV